MRSLFIAFAFATATICAQDWPQFLGPTRDGVYSGANLVPSWPKEGPSVLWRKDVGEGFSGPVVSNGRLLLFHRLGDNETVECLQSTNGNRLWLFDYPTTYRDHYTSDQGPRATPCVANQRVYTFGAEGMLHCLDFASGKKALECGHG